MEGWETTSAAAAEEEEEEEERGAVAKRPAGGRRSDEGRARAVEQGGGKAATVTRLNKLHSSHAERNKKLEQRKAELERQKREAEEASMVQWNSKKKKKNTGRAKASPAKTVPGRDGRSSSSSTSSSTSTAARTSKPSAAAAEEQPRQPGVTAAPAVSTPGPAPAVDGGGMRPGFVVLPDVTPAEFEVFVEAVRGYQGNAAPTLVGASPALGTKDSTPSQVQLHGSDNSPSLDALSTHGQAAVDEFQQLTITELPGPGGLQQQEAEGRQRRQQRRRQQEEGDEDEHKQRRRQERQQRLELREDMRPPDADKKLVANSGGTEQSAGTTVPPSPGSMGDISRAVADAREADEEGDRRTAWVMHMEAVRVYQAAARRCPGGVQRWPVELVAEEAKIVARTAELKREVEQQSRETSTSTKNTRTRNRGGGMFSCCGSNKTGGRNSPGRPTGSAGKRPAGVDSATAAAPIALTAASDAPTLRPASAMAITGQLTSTSDDRGTRSSSASRAVDSRSRSPPSGKIGRSSRREYSPQGNEHGPPRSRSPMSTKATTTQQQIQKLHDGLPTKPTSIKITVKTLTAGESYTVRIGQTASVDALKASIETIEGTEVALQRLAIMTSDGSATRQLTNGNALLSDYDLQDGSTLLLVKRLRHAQLSISTSCDSYTPVSGISDSYTPHSSTSAQGQCDEPIGRSDGGSPDRLSVSSSAASESRIPVHRGTPSRNGKGINSSPTVRQQREVESLDRDGDDDAEKENAEKENARAAAAGEGEDVTRANAPPQAGASADQLNKVAAATAQEERMRRLSEPVRPRGLELKPQSPSSAASTIQGKKITTKKSNSGPDVKRQHLSRKAVLAGAATPKGAATKTTAELKREKAAAEAAEEEARRKAEAWKRKRAREAARKAAAQAQADAEQSRAQGSYSVGVASETCEKENEPAATGDRKPSRSQRKKKGQVEQHDSNETGEQTGVDSEINQTHSQSSRTQSKGKAVIDGSTLVGGREQREEAKENSGEMQPTAVSKRLQSDDRDHSAIDADDVSIDIENDENSHSDSGHRSTPSQRSSSYTDSRHRRGYLSSTSDSYSEDSDEEYPHAVRSVAPLPSDAGVASTSSANSRNRLLLVASPAAAVEARPILSSMSLGFPGGAGETTKGGVLFATARFGAVMADVSGMDAVLCDPEHAAGEELRNGEQLRGCVAVARRGECSFAEKARRVQAAGAMALLVVNSDDNLFVLDGEGAGGEDDDITIPVVMTGATESFRLLAQLRAVAEAAEALQMRKSDDGHGSNIRGADFAPLISFTYDLNGPDGGGKAYSDLQVTLTDDTIDGGETTLRGSNPTNSNGIDWRVHMEGFGTRDSAGNLWVDGAGLMDALQCAFGWQATDEEIDELLEAAGTEATESEGDISYRLDPEGYITVMQDFEEDFAPCALGSPGSSTDEGASTSARDRQQPPASWREQAAWAVEEGYSS